MSSFLYIVPEKIDFVKFITKAVGEHLNLNANILTSAEFLFITDSTIGIDQIRELKRFLYFKPLEYPYKIGVIAPFDNSTLQAQNAILKILEEPPDYGYILLLAYKLSNILDTVLSRCQVVHARQVGLIDYDAGVLRAGVEEMLSLDQVLSTPPVDMYNLLQRRNITKEEVVSVLEQLQDYVVRSKAQPKHIYDMLEELQVIKAALHANYPPQMLMKVLILFVDKYKLSRTRGVRG